MLDFEAIFPITGGSFAESLKGEGARRRGTRFTSRCDRGIEGAAAGGRVSEDAVFQGAVQKQADGAERECGRAGAGVRGRKRAAERDPRDGVRGRRTKGSMISRDIRGAEDVVGGR